ncbi:RHS repeat-associated core domain-containing protein [Nonlabens ulvanivorans]|uniref:RHS repeat-associated core domain-containing protein n=1 Tax=Nonlabens ulvanivorans TaxID=906888 RepID=UPI0029439CA6|nr:RHS repeat-associated core domain-containing protein [Nonlabens ulvanivorans]WOI21613.1 RHS repeat-associated core domain-containing protein [Nonlabens ulvanivorans]
MEYLPFGETLVEEHQNSYNVPYKFNGKELDGETGNYYYGARYYNPKFSQWLSVDPLAEQTMDSYGYVWNNPLNYTDPTGMSGESVQDDYGLDDNGYVRLIQKTDDKYDRLYAVNECGEIKDQDNYVQVNKSKSTDGTIISDLQWEDINYNTGGQSLWGIKTGVWAKTSNRSDAYKVFKFGADNSGVEWALEEYSGNRFIIGNSHFSETVARFNSVSGYNILHLKRFYHSHPGTSTADDVASNEYGDQGVATNIIYKFLDAKIDYNRHPTFHIYRPDLNKKFDYNPWQVKFNERNVKTYRGL